ncbi:MAG: hypothetical protein C0417_10765 [Chlorobiaceae bacterium]|nr:hypothetical protein [Chlorobiaceae bacterium]
MVLSKKNPRVRELSFQALLNKKVCDLELRSEDTLRECLIQLRHELSEKQIEFFPHFYFGDEPWGCIDRTGSVEIPFYLANNTLRRIGEKYFLSYTKEEIMMILRHETGHAINYAYKLWIREDWKKLFGKINKRYPNLYHFNPASKDFVKYLHYVGHPHYAQKHPDEDFAETFAVWLDPVSKWKQNYKTWKPAIEKLIYVDFLFGKEKLAQRRPLRVRFTEASSYKNIISTIAEYFNIEKKVDPRLKEYTEDLQDIFSSQKDGKRKLIRADLFIQHFSRYLEEELVEWIAKADRHGIRKYLRELQTICALNNLQLHPDQTTEKLVELVIVSTYHLLKRLKVIK